MKLKYSELWGVLISKVVVWWWWWWGGMHRPTSNTLIGPRPLASTQAEVTKICPIRFFSAVVTVTRILPIVVWALMSSPAQSLASAMKSAPRSSSVRWPWQAAFSV